ncbi:MAG: type III pantothenate kinase [Phycisphaeraceae bacterium]|nr:type III pantothenate kinase [Phycisphaeraceae bacterium]
MNEAHDQTYPPPAALLIVGNTRARTAHYAAGAVHHSASHSAGDAGSIAAALAGFLDDHHGAALLVASVNRPAAEAAASAMEGRADRVAFAGRDFAIPMRTTVDRPERVGIDRLLCSLAAFRMAEQACIVIDAGTAITVDFVDGLGVHQGGAICPGVGAMLSGLVSSAPALPSLTAAQALAIPFDPQAPWGRDTEPAIALGVRAAAVGLVHDLVDRFAQAYGAYPRVIATGGDAAALFEHDELVEHVVPDLQLAGLARAYEALLDDEDD